MANRSHKDRLTTTATHTGEAIELLEEACGLPATSLARAMKLMTLHKVLRHCHEELRDLIGDLEIGSEKLQQEETLREKEKENSGHREVSVAVPLLTTEEAREKARALAKELDKHPYLWADWGAVPGCWNCRQRTHTAKECTFRRGTFCGRCGEPGMILAYCPYCYPEKFGVKRPPGVRKQPPTQPHRS